MGDTISRSAAIAEIEEYIEEYSELDRNGLHILKWCAMEEAKMVLEKAPDVDAVRVIRCKDCGHCFELAATDPLTPYHGGKEGFYCEAWDTDFYTTHYNPETYYCGDAKPRAAEQPAGLYADKDPFQDVLMPAT